MIESIVKSFKLNWESIEKQSEIVGAGLSIKDALLMKSQSVILEGIESSISREIIIESLKIFGSIKKIWLAKTDSINRAAFVLFKDLESRDKCLI